MPFSKPIQLTAISLQAWIIATLGQTCTQQHFCTDAAPCVGRSFSCDQSGGCCLISCIGTGVCEGADLECVRGVCDLDCSGTDSCKNMDISLYTLTSALDKQCGTDSCEGLTITGKTHSPTSQPSLSPTGKPSAAPSGAPSSSPTPRPTSSPLITPTARPSAQPTAAPSAAPSLSPTTPTAAPTCLTVDCDALAACKDQTLENTVCSRTVCSGDQSCENTIVQCNSDCTVECTGTDSCLNMEIQLFGSAESTLICGAAAQATCENVQINEFPTQSPTKQPSRSPTPEPTAKPTSAPTRKPSTSPTKAPSNQPSASPTRRPSNSPSTSPTSTADTPTPTANTQNPTALQTTGQPTTAQPTTADPTPAPTTAEPTPMPTQRPTASPSAPTVTSVSQSINNSRGLSDSEKRADDWIPPLIGGSLSMFAILAVVGIVVPSCHSSTRVNSVDHNARDPRSARQTENLSIVYYPLSLAALVQVAVLAMVLARIVREDTDHLRRYLIFDDARYLWWIPQLFGSTLWIYAWRVVSSSVVNNSHRRRQALYIDVSDYRRSLFIVTAVQILIIGILLTVNASISDDSGKETLWLASSLVFALFNLAMLIWWNRTSEAELNSLRREIESDRNQEAWVIADRLSQLTLLFSALVSAQAVGVVFLGFKHHIDDGDFVTPDLEAAIVVCQRLVDLAILACIFVLSANFCRLNAEDPRPPALPFPVKSSRVMRKDPPIQHSPMSVVSIADSRMEPARSMTFESNVRPMTADEKRRVRMQKRMNRMRRAQ